MLLALGARVRLPILQLHLPKRSLWNKMPLTATAHNSWEMNSSTKAGALNITSHFQTPLQRHLCRHIQIPLQTHTVQNSHHIKIINKKHSLLQTYIPTYMPYFKVPLKGSRAGSGRVQRVHQHLEKKQPGGDFCGFTPHQSESRRTDQQLHLIYLHYLRRTPRAAGSFTDRFRMV